jgi:hypothetical protein
VNPDDADLDRWIRAACPPVEPSEGLRERVLVSARPRPVARRLLRIAVPFAAGVLSALGAERMLASPAPVDPSPASDVARRFEPIADRPAPPPPAPAESPTPTAPAPVDAPLPRIS